jgi:hypothetical protein
MNCNLKNKLKNFTNGKKYITNIIEKYNENEKVDNIELLELLQYHPTKHINIENIDYLIMKIRKPFNKLALFYKYKYNEKEDDISYILCIKNLFGKYDRDKHYEEDVMTAFRNESHVGSKKQFFIHNTIIRDDLFYGICENCKIETSNISTDHFPFPYKQLFSNFMKKENIILSNIEIYENDVNEIKIKNEELANKFRIFHDEHASYRLLCKSCNSHFGSYEKK